MRPVALVTGGNRVLGINLRGTFFLTQSAARRMLADTPPAHSRSIVTISSANATIASSDRAEYCLAKAGLAMMTKLYALRLAPAGIGVYEIRPGIIRTDMTKVAGTRYDKLIAAGLTPIARWGEPADVGRAVAMLARGDLSCVTAKSLRWRIRRHRRRRRLRAANARGSSVGSRSGAGGAVPADAGLAQLRPAA